MKRHEPTEDARLIVRGLAAIGTPQEQIARVLDISEPTLRKYYRDELDCGGATARATVAGALFDKATGGGPGSVTAAIFWLKARAGWRDR